MRTILERVSEDTGISLGSKFRKVLIIERIGQNGSGELHKGNSRTPL